MKTKIILLAAILLLTLNIKAQAVKKGDFNIALNVGYVTPYTFDNDYANSGAPIGIGLGYAISNKTIIGIEGGYFSLTTKDKNVDAVHTLDFYGNDSIAANAYSYNVKYDVVFFLADLEYHWLNKDKFSLYTGLGLGYYTGTPTINASDNTDHNASITLDNFSGFAYQGTLLGMKSWFGKHVGVHLELGYGIKGIVRGGLDFKF